MDIGISRLWNRFQPTIFPDFDETPSETSDGHRRLILILDNLSVFIFALIRTMLVKRKGRRKIYRFSFVAAFIAMKVLRISTVKALIDRFNVDGVLRRICFLTKGRIPCEATFSNVFKELSIHHFAEKLHEAMIKANLEEDLAHNVSRDSTAIEVREKPAKKTKKKNKTKKKIRGKRGRPKKNEQSEPKEEKRLDKQLTMSLPEMLIDLPNVCDKGGKKDAKGNTNYWNGYKLHIDTIEGDIPVSAILSSASVHDSQVAIPLEEMTSQRINSLYTLMDAAYDAPQIKDYVTSKGKVPVIDHNPRRGEKIPMEPPKKDRYKARSSAERVNSNIKDNCGAREIRVRGPEKVMTYLSFGLVAIAAEQILKLY